MTLRMPCLGSCPSCSVELPVLPGNHFQCDIEGQEIFCLTESLYVTYAERLMEKLLEQHLKSKISDLALCFQVWIWSKAKFINRKFLTKELYQRFLNEEDGQEKIAQEDGPFWDPVEVIHLGSAHLWLQSLAYRMKLEEQVEFLDWDGLEEAVLHIHMAPCSPTGLCVFPSLHHSGLSNIENS